MARFNHELLRTLRLDLGMSQEEAAKTLRVDVRTYRRYEAGTVNAGRGFDVRHASRRALLRRMCKQLGVADEEAWLVPSEVKPSSERRSGHKAARRGHVLQRAKNFVGRGDILARLSTFVEGDAAIWVVVGVGGSGKTSVVERFVSTLRTGVWVHSFYDDPRTESAVEELSRARGPVVVLDGLEAVQSTGGNGRAFGELDDPALRRALRAVCSGLVSRKVLATSRFPLSDLEAWEGDRLTTLPLPPLAQADALDLLRAWGLSGNDAELAPIHERTGGHALSLAMVGSYVGTFFGGDARYAREIPDDAPSDDHTARRLASVLDSYAHSLAPHERQLLSRLSLFAGAADVPLLASLSGSSDNEVLVTTARLERLGLVARTRAGVSAHPFVREHFKRLLGSSASSAHAKISDVIASTLEGKPSARVSSPDLLDRYETLLLHTLRGGRQHDAWGIYERALGGFENLGLRLGAMTRGARVLASFAEGNAPERLDPALEGTARTSVLYDWALYAGALGDLRLAARCHDAHLRALDDIRDDVAAPFRAMGLRTRAYVAWLAGELDVARRYLDGSLEVARALDDERAVRFHVSRGLALRAMVEHDAGDLDAAMRALDAVRELEGTPTARRALWEAEIRLAGGDHARALALATTSLTDCARRGWLGHVAHAHTVLGLVSVDDAPAKAKKHLTEAWPWVHASNEVEMALRCHLLAARIALRGRRGAEAARALATGKALAETHGVARFGRLFAALG